LLEEPVSFPEAYYNAALVSHSQGNYEEAIRLFKQALSKPFSGLTAVTQDEIQTKIDYLNRGQGGMV
ncbi:MAG TPA: tetratricopeptide repeat protein, partial [Clostridia bacterium]|nr:tetratricopeptide repeat protein [Clostridia bacterium]